MVLDSGRLVVMLSFIQRVQNLQHLVWCDDSAHCWEMLDVSGNEI